MGDTINFYKGSNYGLDANYGELFKEAGVGSYRFSPSTFGYPTDPRMVNQVEAVSKKLSTGAKAIEVSGIQTQQLESIPKQHFKEINRLKQLAGVDLTFHGPIVEPTGITRAGWEPSHREQAERQMWSAVQRSHDLEPDGNIVVTFHSSAINLDPEVKVFNEKTGKEEVKEIYAVNSRTGEFNRILTKKNFLTGQEDATEVIKENNEEYWTGRLAQASFRAHQGREAIEESSKNIKKAEEVIQNKMKIDPVDFYYKSSGEEGRKFIESLEPETRRAAETILSNVNYAHINVRNTYNELQELFSQAWEAAEKSRDKKSEEDKRKLLEYQQEFKNKRKEFEVEGGGLNPRKIPEIADEVSRGVRLLSTLSSTPKILEPMKDFMIDQASETFSNLAFNSYKEFAYNKNENTAPIISIENPPAGGGIARGEDLRELVKKAQEKFKIKAEKELNLSPVEAERQAKKLIGVTWDVGHINMLRKFGYDDKQLVKQTEKVAPYVKHIHLSDNFGLDHTELPMGMGNVPLKGHIDTLQKQYGEKLKEIKQVVETGNWFEPFKTTPVKETLQAYGSPIYGMKMAPYWNQVSNTSGGYFSGYGLNPDIHHSIYGSGFSGIPVELGGQITGRNRLSGSPTD